PTHHNDLIMDPLTPPTAMIGAASRRGARTGTRGIVGTRDGGTARPAGRWSAGSSRVGTVGTIRRIATTERASAGPRKSACRGPPAPSQRPTAEAPARRHAASTTKTTGGTRTKRPRAEALHLAGAEESS